MDGHSLAHRAYYALPPLTTNSGLVTNAAYGFSMMLMRLIEDYKPCYMAVAFDMEGPTFRHERYEKYKAHRDKTPDDLAPQFDLIREILTAFGIPIFEKRGYEADDLIGTLADFCSNQGLQTQIVTGDRDALQLVSSEIEVLYTRKGITDLVHYNLEKIREEYELEPKSLVDMKGLMGDKSDNIPGVDGIGKKTAVKLLHQFGDLETVLDNISEVSGKKRKETLREQAEQAILSKELVRIDRRVPMDIDLETLRHKEPNEEEVKKVFGRLEFKQLLERMGLAGAEGVIKEELKPDLKKIMKNEDLKELLDEVKARIALEVRGEEEPEFYLAASPNTIYCYQNAESEVTLSYFVQQLKPLFSDPELEKYIYRAKSNLKGLLDLGIEVKGLVFDPCIAAYLISPGDRQQTISQLAKDYLDLGLKSDDEEPAPENVVYLLFLLLPEMEKKLKMLDLEVLYSKVELPLVKVLAEMEKKGSLVDTEQLEELSSELKQRLEGLIDQACSLAGKEFNLNSPKQLSEVLFEELELPVIRRTKTGYSTAADVLEQLVDKHDIVPLILEYRQLMKLKSTYVDALLELIDPETKRIHTSFNQLVTSTGRLSSTEPNLQNIPIRTEEGRKIRKAFIPASGHLLLSADYSQVELRVLAHISEDPGLREAFTAEEDIHRRTASEVFGVSQSEVTREQRRRAKAINFGIAYGMSPYGLARDLDISNQEAAEYIERYFTRYPGVKQYINQTIERAREEGCVRTLLGRVRFLPNLKSRNHQQRQFAERMAINTPIQGSAADIIKLAMVDVYSRLHAQERVKMLLQVHDELVFEVLEEELEDVAVMVKKGMEEAVELSVPLVVDLKAGKNWRDTEELVL